jgi:hypothetical protein
MNIRLLLFALAAFAALFTVPGIVRAQIFVTNFNSGTVGEYTTSGAPINPALISGLPGPTGIAVSGDKLFVKNGDKISEYTTSGALVNAALISDVVGNGNVAVSGHDLFAAHDHPLSDADSVVGKYTTSGGTVDPALIGLDTLVGAIPDMEVSGDKLFLALGNLQRIAEYTTSGVLVNPNLIPGLSLAQGIAISGDKLFVLNLSGINVPLIGTVGEYTLSGTPVNPSLITGLISPTDIAVSGGSLFVVNQGNAFEGLPGTIGKYTTSGETVNATLVSGLNEPRHIAIASQSVPDTSPTWILLLLGLAVTFVPNPLLRRV